MSSKASVTLDLHALGRHAVVYVVKDGRGELHTAHATEQGATAAAAAQRPSSYSGTYSVEQIPVHGSAPITSDRWSAFADEELHALAGPIAPREEGGGTYAQLVLHQEIQAEIERRKDDA